MSTQGARTRSPRRIAALAAIGAIGALGVAAVPTAANAAGQDEAGNLEFAFGCAAKDNMTAALSFHVDAFETTPAERRIVAVRVDVNGVDGYVDVDVLTPAAGYDYYVTADYDLDVEVGRSFLDGDALTATILRSDGTSAGGASTTAACFDGGTTATVHDFAVTARVGSPRAIRLLEHVTYGGLDAGNVVKARITSGGESWAAGWVGTGTSDDLVLDAATGTSLGASLADSVLTVSPTAVGDYALRWGVVTSADEAGWTGGSGVESGPATLTLHVIERPPAPTEALIVASPHGPVVVPPSATIGGSVTVGVGSEYQGQYVDVWLRSDPIYLGFVPVQADGTITVTLPASVPAGDHRMIVADEAGTLVGWGDVAVTVAAAPAATPTAGTSPAPAASNTVPLAATGMDEAGATTWWPAAVLALLAIAATALGLRTREVKRRA